MIALGSRGGRQVTRLAGSLAVVAFGAGMAEAADGSWPSSVSARYTLAFGGFEVGKYQFQSLSDGKTYTVSSNASVSALFGAFSWKGAIEAKGSVEAGAPHPAAYQMNFKAKAKDGSVKLKFDKAGVATVTLLPNKPPSPEAVPVKPEHMKSVFDPMTAILAMTHPQAGNPCNQTVPIFDGKARFDLQMSLKGEQRLTEKKPSGQPANLVVCKVHYVPVAGHKPKDFVNPWVDYSAIEISLRPIPSANVYVPYRVSIPTSLGAAVMTVEQIDITAANKAQIALTQ